MVMANEDDYYEDEDVPVSNPLPPPPRPPPKKDKASAPQFSNLSNSDFRKMVIETPRRGDEKARPKGRSGHTKRAEEEPEGKEDGKAGSKKYRPKLKDDEKDDPDGPKYRDRAKERREEVNPDYEATTQELGSLNAVAPPGVDLNIADAHRISIENSKFLGGDVEHTHLVKGLDYALLQKVRSEMKDGKDEDEDDEDQPRKRERAKKEPVSIRTGVGKSVYQWIVKPHKISKINEMFLPGRTAFVFDMDEEFSHDIPTTVHRSRADCPQPEEAFNAGVDAAVLERISKIMSYLRLGSSGKLMKKKKKRDDDSKILVMGIPSLAGEEGLGEDERLPPMPLEYSNGGGVKEESAREARAPPEPREPPREPERLPPPPPPDEDDIFDDVGTNYEPTRKAPRSPVSEDMEESPRDREEVQGSYFQDGGTPPPLPPEEHVPPPPPPADWHMQGAPAEPHMQAAGPMMPQFGAEWQEYPQAPPDPYAAATWASMNPYPPQEQYYEEPPPPGHEYAELPAGMTQEDKDKGMGSVFKRDDQRLLQMRETDAREKDPNFVSESYSECYPGYQEYNREIVESDEEEDLTKMDLGAKAKKGLHPWDFATEDEWSKYNESKEAMPKAAFQFGVKMKDGRKTGKTHKEQKLNNDLHKINQLLKKRKDDEQRGWNGEDEDYGDKRLRV